MANENAPDGNGEGKTKWEEAGFADETAMIEAAKAAADLRSQIEKAEGDLKKEREAKSKTDSQFMKQAQEIGDLRKKLKEVEKPPETLDDKNKDAGTGPTDEEVLESMSDDEEAALLKVLNDPKQAELKKAVIAGGDKAKAEYVRNYRANAPVEKTVLTLKKRKANTVQTSDIAGLVKSLFKKNDENNKNNLAVTPANGAPPNAAAKTTRQMQVGGVDASFFIKKE
jgi:predicted nuclease with TOPRIM domain